MKKILVVEDEVIISRYIGETLNPVGYDIKVANSIEEAKEIFSSFLPNLVLMDVDLDDSIDGIELSLQLLEKDKDLGIVFLTSDSSATSLVRVNTINYLNYILKPIDENQLRTSVHLAFEKLNSSHKEKKDILDLLNRLTKTEKKILKQLANDLTSVQVSEKLFISKKTVENHRYNICKKLDLKAQKNSLLIFVTSNKATLKSINI